MKQPFAHIGNGGNYDVFISYRRKSRSSLVHSTSLARSVALEFESQGYSVYFDCWDNENGWRDALESSRNIVVLLTGYSFDSDKLWDGKTPKSLELFFNTEELNDHINNILGEDTDGGCFREEVRTIIQKIYKDKAFGPHVRWVNVDGEMGKTKGIERFLLYNFQVSHLDTSAPFLLTSINISKEKTNEKAIITKKKRQLSNKSFRRLALVMSLVSFVLVLALAGVWLAFRHQKNDLMRCSDNLMYCSELHKAPKLLIAGGGSAKNYVRDSLSLDVNNYEGSLYVHMPSGNAATLLFDEINDSLQRYYPVVLSTGPLDTTVLKDESRKRFMIDFSKRVVEVELGETPLRVQLINYKGNKYKNWDSVSVEELRSLINNTKNKLYCTGSSSGTFKKYYDLDIIKGRDCEEFSENEVIDATGTLKIILGNDSYYQKSMKEDKVTNLRVLKGDTLQTIKIFACAVASREDKDGSYRVVEKNVQEFLRELGCDTTVFAKHGDTMTLHWPDR